MQEVNLDFYVFSHIIRMEDLFTFNSHQLQNLSVVKPPGKENLITPQIRKRIVSKASSKRLVRSNSTQSESAYPPTTFRDSQKKVTFQFGDQPSIRKDSLDELLRMRMPHSAVTNRKTHELVDYRSSELRKSEHQYIYDRPIRKLVKRVFSTVEPRRQTNMEDDIRVSNKSDQPIRTRQKRSNTMRGNPKIMINVSNQKLPDAFKGRFGERYLSKIKRAVKEELRPAPRPILCESHRNNSTLFCQIQRFKMLLHRESSFINKLSAKEE